MYKCTIVLCMDNNSRFHGHGHHFEGNHDMIHCLYGNPTSNNFGRSSVKVFSLYTKLKIPGKRLN